jgi:hypothetical protein
MSVRQLQVEVEPLLVVPCLSQEPKQFALEGEYVVGAVKFHEAASDGVDGGDQGWVVDGVVPGGSIVREGSGGGTSDQVDPADFGDGLEAEAPKDAARLFDLGKRFPPDEVIEGRTFKSMSEGTWVVGEGGQAEGRGETAEDDQGSECDGDTGSDSRAGGGAARRGLRIFGCVCVAARFLSR